MASKKTTSSDSESAPFGAGAIDSPSDLATDSGGSRRKPRPKGEGTRSRRRRPPSESKTSPEKADQPRAKSPEQGASEAGEARPKREDSGDRPQRSRRRRWQDRRGRRRKKGGGGGESQETREAPREGAREGGAKPAAAAPSQVVGMLVVEKGNHGHLRSKERDYLEHRNDPHVPPRMVQKYDLRSGSILEGSVRRGQGRHKWELVSVDRVDGLELQEARRLPHFKGLTSIDPDFHYEVGDASGEVSLKVLDLICPVGRGQRGLIVAPPRSGKTILLQQFAKAIETTYPEVHLMVLLVDERPEEATEWRRSTGGEVYVSTNDETHRRHVDLAEAVWNRCRRRVELGEDVVLLLDSITRLGRAYNNVHGNSGKTMSGGIDTRALERPKQFFGAARNTETAGSLTILGTTLIETGSRMDQVIFEEFKGTGNMELVLSRKLADRRVFPAIDLVKSGTRKEEKLLSSTRLRRVNTLRRVLSRMHFAEAMELLVTKLDDVEKIDDFLQRFDVDPEE